MKSVIAAILIVGFSVVAYAETTTSTESLFQEGSCFEKNEYCEFTDFRGQSHEYWFGSSMTSNPDENLYPSVPFYSGPLVNGVSCDAGLCTNDKREVIGLDPQWGPFKEEFSKQSTSGSSQNSAAAIQQASEPPYEISSRTINNGTDAYPVPLNQLVITSKVNGLDINSVTINDGNPKCKHYLAMRKYETINMGDSINVAVPTNCSVVKLEIITNMGGWEHVVK